MRNIFLVLTTVLGLSGLSAGPSWAQATRTWVSGVGDDANPCSRTAPCKTFAGAISKTAPRGEINVIDPGGFGAVTITKAITIRSDGVTAGVLVSGTNGVIVAAGATDKVVLEGLDIEGLGPSVASLNGIKVISGQAVYVLRCAIRNFINSNGIDGNGILVNSTTAGTRVFIRDSFIENNTGGLLVKGQGVSNAAVLWNTLVDGNTSFAVTVNGANNVLAVIQSILAASPIAISLLNGGTAVSSGPSNVVVGSGAFSTTVPFK